MKTSSMIDKKVVDYEVLTRLGEASASFIPFSDKPKTRGIPEPSLKEYIILSQGVPLSEVSASSLRKPLSDVVANSFEKARIFSLLGASKEAGLIQYECPLMLEEILTLLKVDGGGVIGYSEDFSFSFYLDYDKTGCVIEMEFLKNHVN